MYKKQNTQLLITSFLLAIIFVGCKSTKTITYEGKIVEKSQQELFSDVLNKEINYRTVTGKTTFEFVPANSKKMLKVTTVIKLIKDNAIQMSLRGPFGVEVGRLTLTPDSIFLIDRMNKRYVMEDITKMASSDVVFNFYNLQALLTNNLFYPGESTLTKQSYQKFVLDVASNMYLLKAKDNSGTLYNFAIDGTDRIQSTLIFSPKKNATLQCSYDNFIQDGGFVYPTALLWKVNMDKKRFDAKITYSKLDFNKEIEIDNSVPKKYEKVTIGDVLKAFIK